MTARTPRRSKLAMWLAVAGDLLRRPLPAVSFLWLTAVVAGALLAGFASPDPLRQDLLAAYTGPSPEHLLGTDVLGRDIFTRLLAGTRPTLVGVLTAVAVFTIGIPLGVIAGYRRGWLDRVISFTAEVLYAIPGLVVLLVVLAVFTKNSTAAMVTLGVLGAAGLVRVLRGNTIAIKNELYVRAARTSGLTTSQIIRRHVLPRLVGPIVVQTSLFAGAAIMVETALGYLGFGPTPPNPSWGSLVADASQAINRHPWMLAPTGAVIILTVLAFGLVGDGIRDSLAARWNPTDRRRGGRRSLRSTLSASGPQEPFAPQAALSVRGLTVAFANNGDETVVVKDVSFDVAPGEILGIVGESGSGKSVTAMAVLGLLKDTGRVVSGEARFGPDDLFTMPPKQRRALRGNEIALISQDPVSSLDPAFTVGFQLTRAIRRHTGLRRRAASERALELLQQVRLPDPERVLSLYPHELSGGMAQRVCIALALSGGPSLLIADEPTTALDVTIQKEILDLIDDLRRKTGMSVILITHDFGVLAHLADRGAVMYAGEVVESASVRGILDDPQMPYTVGMIRSLPSASVPGHALPALPGTVIRPESWPVGCHFQSRCPIVTDECRGGPIPLLDLDARRARCVRPGSDVDFRTGSDGGRSADPDHAASASETIKATPLLHIDGVSVEFRGRHASVRAVDGVSLEVPRGRTVGLVGESGAGKSTIGQAVLGLVPTSGGRILFDGQDITHATPAERRRLARDIQVVYQDPLSSLNPVRTVGETLEEPLRFVLGLTAAEATSEAEHLMSSVGLEPSALARYPFQFSGGQRQRIAIARALAVRPKLIVCDEVTSALDLSVQAQILNLLTRLQDEYGLTYLFVSHDLGVVRHMSDTVAVLRGGRLQEVGDAETVFAHPTNDYTKTLIGAASLLVRS